MTLREKTIAFMNLTLAPFEESVSRFVGQFRDQFDTALGLTPEADAAISAIEQEFKSGGEALTNAAADVFERHLDEVDIDALLAHREHPAEKKLREVSQGIQDEVIRIQDAWMRASLDKLAPELRKILGDAGPEPAQAEAEAPEPTATESAPETPPAA